MDDKDMSNRALLERIQQLEARIADLESQNVSQAETPKKGRQPVAVDGIPTK